MMSLPLEVAGTAMIQAAGPLLILLLKMTLVLLAGLALSATLRRASAGSRHLVWLAVLAGLAALPPLAAWAPLPLPILPAEAAAPEGAVSTDGGGAVLTVGSGTVTAAPTPASVPAPAPTLPSLGTVLLWLWAAGAALLLLRLAHGAWAVRRIVRQARPLEAPGWQGPLYEIADRMGLESAPRLLQSDQVSMPFAAGLFAPAIVLPAESESWSAERRSAVLIHELGHVRRRDLLGHTLSRVVCAVYWFHPLVWTAARQLRAESERACDDLALDYGARPSDYAEHLLDIVTAVRDHRTPAVALAMAHRREFEGRMLAILNPELERRGPSRFASLSLAGSVAGIALLVSAAAPVARPGTVAGEPLVLQAPATPQSPVAGDTAAPGPRPLPQADPRPHPDPRPQPSPSPAPAVGGTRTETAINTRTETATRTSQAEATIDRMAGDGPDDERAAVLAKTLRDDSSAEVRRVAAWGLQRYARLDVARTALLAALAKDSNEEVREMAAWALASAGLRSGVGAALVQALKAEKSASVRATAAWAAGTLGDPDAVPALVPLLSAAEAEVRELAAWGIGNCRPRSAPPELLRALTDQSASVREAAAWAVYTMRDETAAPALERAFRAETDADVRAGQLRALGSLGDAALPVLQQLVTSPDSTVRAMAVTGLAGGSIGGPWPWPMPRPRPFP